MPTRAITNNYADMELWNMGGQGRGPYLVVQAGYAPRDDQMTEALFVLRPDGKWADAAFYVTSNKPELLDAAVFPSTQAIMQLLEQLPPKPEVDPLPISAEALRSWVSMSAGGGTVERVRRWVEDYRQRQKNAPLAEPPSPEAAAAPTPTSAPAPATDAATKPQAS